MSGSGCGDLAGWVAVLRVVAELVLVAVAVVAVLLPAPMLARGERSRWSPRAELRDVGCVAQGHATRR